jgi:hypothetical protein
MEEHILDDWEIPLFPLKRKWGVVAMNGCLDGVVHTADTFALLVLCFNCLNLLLWCSIFALIDLALAVPDLLLSMYSSI